MDQKTNTNSVYVLIFGFILGTLVSSFIFVAPVISVLMVIVGLSLLVVEKIRNKIINKEVLFLSLALLSFGLGNIRYLIKDFHEPLVPTSEGVVISEPEQRENGTRFVLLSDNGVKVLINTDLYSSVEYGDLVQVVGKLEEPGLIDGENGDRPFDYGAYLSKDDIYYTMSFAKVDVLSSGHGYLIKKVLLKIKHSFVNKMRGIFAEPESSLLAGLIVAGKTAIPKDISEEFRRAGIIHIVVLSGYNITIIALFMRKMFESIFLWTSIGARPKAAATASVIGIILFVLMTGAEATVVRAALMALILISSKMFGRKYSASRALLVAGVLMLIVNPKILVFDPSFQLSFLATCALIYIVPIVERYLHIVPEKWGLRMMVATTLATQVTVLPLLVYSMGNLSFVSLPANILILLIIPMTMLLGFVATLASYISVVVALPFSYVTHLLLAWILGVSHYLGNLSFASIAIPQVSVWFIALVYLSIVIFAWRSRSYAQRSAN